LEEEMTDSVAASEPAVEPGTPPLSQLQRLVNIFVAPSKTFTDILRDPSWWLPFLITVVVSVGFAYAVQERVGWDKVAENTIQASPKQQDRMANMTPDQVARVKRGMASSFKYISYASPVLALIIAGLVSAVLLATLNFAFAGRAKFNQMLAVYFYSTFPLNLKYLLAIIAVFVGMDPDQFKLQNPVGTNLGYYLSPDSAPSLIALATQIGIFTLWGLVLFSLGSTIVGRVKRRQGAAAVIGWWIVFVFLAVVGASFQSK
jgi:Yip1 domain